MDIEQLIINKLSLKSLLTHFDRMHPRTVYQVSYARLLEHPRKVRLSRDTVGRRSLIRTLSFAFLLRILSFASLVSYTSLSLELREARR